MAEEGVKWNKMETLISGLGKREGKGLERRKIKKWFSLRVGNASEQ